MKLTEEAKQKIRKILEEGESTINDLGEIDKDKMLLSPTIGDILELDGYIFYSAANHQMAISNWCEE